MSHSCADLKATDRWRRGFALTLVLLTLTTAGVQAIAAVRAKVDNPHGSFKDECSLCHSAEGWKPAHVKPAFDHGKRYGFPLTGAHATDDCLSCHTTLEFKQSKTQCESCHSDPHRGEMGSDCARCHSARSFVDRSAMLQQHQMTRFPLSGSHAALECENCHRPTAQGQMQFVNTRAECQACHLTDYQAARTPDHSAGAFPTDCVQCHSTLTWSTAKFDHDRSAFPLTGKHRTAACAQCHGDGVFRGKTTDCYTCHTADYVSAAAPNHVQSQLPHACVVCHNTSAFQPAAYNHDLTAFPLTGAHRAAACNDCHGDGVYRGKATACEGCHTAQYNATTAPAHTAASFPMQCASCHSTTAWTPSSWDHDTSLFPIYSGTHRGRWTNCNDCHTNAQNYQVFTCLSCHPHSDQATTDSHHQGERNYSYTSAACYSCHPRGTH